MKKPLNIVIGNGPMWTPIDSVRCITNHSSGTTGSLIAETALTAGDLVTFVHSKNSQRPFQSRLHINTHCDDIDDELGRLKDEYEVYTKIKDTLNEIPIGDFQDYHDTICEQVSRTEVDVAILSAAVTDHGCDATTGKISSDTENLTLQLHTLPKVISQVKAINPNLFLVGFKLLTQESSQDTLIEKAYTSMQRDKQDLAVANIADENMQPVETFIINNSGDTTPITDRNNLPQKLINMIREKIHS